MTSHTILWRHLDRAGHESARLSAERDGWRLAGSSVFAEKGQSCRLNYVILCDVRWNTTSASVDGWIGDRVVALEIAVFPPERWQVNGIEMPAVVGCIDIDLNWSPATNLLPIRRLGLGLGDQAAVRAAWLRFPSLTLEPLAQVYRRIADRAYRYESSGGAFVAELQVDDAGFVTHYPDFCEREDAR